MLYRAFNFSIQPVRNMAVKIIELLNDIIIKTVLLCGIIKIFLAIWLKFINNFQSCLYKRD